MRHLSFIFVVSILAAMLGACTPGTTDSPESTTDIASPTRGVPTATNTSVPVPTRTPTLTPTPKTEIGPFRRIAAVPEFGRLAVTSNGALYLLGVEAAYLLEGNEWTVLFDDAPGSLLGVAPNGEIWAAEGLAIYQWNESGWHTFDGESDWTRSEDESAIYDYVDDILFASDGSLWLTTSHDVRRFDGQRWRIYGFAEMAISNTWLEDPEDFFGLTFTISEVNGAIWLGGCKFYPPGPVSQGSGLRWFNGASWRTPYSPASSGCITAIAQAPDGSVWMDLSKDVAPTDNDPFPKPDQGWIRYDPVASTWESHPLPKPEDFNRWAHVLDLSFDASSNPWLEMEACGGASCYGFPTRFYFNRAADSFVLLEYERVSIFTYLLFDRNGQGWLFSRGIYQLVDEEFVLVDDLATVSAVQDSSGRIWALAYLEDELGLWASDEG
jgi:hypothetical protein